MENMDLKHIQGMTAYFNPMVGFVICKNPEISSRKYTGWVLIIWFWKWCIAVGTGGERRG